MSEQDMENFDVKEKRKSLFGLLGHVLVTAKKKFDMEKASNSDRQSWARIVVSGVEAYARLLQTVQLDELEKRIQKLEEVKS